MEFLTARLAEGSDIIIKSLANELDLTQSMSTGKIAKLEAELNEVREEYIKEKDNLSKRLVTAESERTQLAAKE